MVTKAIIDSIESPYQVKVRIPLINSVTSFSQATAKENLSSAIICTLPKCQFIPEVGDIVIVAFEDNDAGKPIIIGCLFKESGNTSSINLVGNSLNISGTTKLSEQTTIGTISYNELLQVKNIIANLKGINDQIQITQQIQENTIYYVEGSINPTFPDGES